jgi:photosystem II stability/assembly factor-like uncharacterized protein
VIVGIVQWNHPGAHSADQHPLTSSEPPATQGQGSGDPTPGATVSTGLPGGSVPPAFRVIDLTFISARAGWALGTGGCLDGSPDTCPAILRTSDGGANWISTPTPPAPIGRGCAAPCVAGLRFASDQVGYAYGPGALYMTTDGGESWGENEGDASALEVANGVALRVGKDTLQAAPVGKASWHAVTLPGPASRPVSAQSDLVRAMHRAYVTATTGELYASSNDGSTWIRHDNPCGSSPSSLLAPVADGGLVVACAAASGSAPTLRVSADDAKSFTSCAVPVKAKSAWPVAAIDASTLFVVSSGTLQRSTDQGNQWTPVASDTTSGDAAFLGFENSTTGRWVTGDGSTIYTTSSAGTKWTQYRFR